MTLSSSFQGKKLCIVVSVKGYGHEYDVIWLRNLQEITDGMERVRLTKKRHMCSLKIDSVEHDSIGIYMCIVSSNGGEASIKFNLDVKGMHFFIYLARHDQNYCETFSPNMV